MSTSNFEHRLDALGRSMASGHGSALPPAIREGVAVKGAAAQRVKVGAGAATLVVIVLAIAVLSRRGGVSEDPALLDDIESIRRAVAPVWREQVKDAPGAAGSGASGTSGTARAGDRGGGGPAGAVK
ncbi:MAG: hypothetical protein JNL50_14500 [Phycisphaerae bacterium]|nr:hypothetical protein [Phycisphaerae bacterium]